MPFWIFGKKREEPREVRSLDLSVDERKGITEEDLQLLVDHFHRIARHLSKIEHAASAKPSHVSEIEKDFESFKTVISKLRKSEPGFSAYWNNIFNVMDDYVYSIKKLLPESVYEMSISQEKIEKLGRFSRASTSDFMVLLEDVKKKLGKQYKRDFNVSWPKKSALY
ncbi:MAG: hypothetical protein KJ767_00715 [Nanoarchaeota archaeon]|nr:hypothetical protein [Nanoarchaeota archaeon]